MKLGKRAVALTHTDRVIYPRQGISKRDVIDYYKSVSSLIIPYLQKRPLMLERFPGGIQREGFYQKRVPENYPEWIKIVTVPKSGGEVRQVLCNNLATLIYLVNQGTISFHPWLSRAGMLNYPDKFIIDLDPASDDFNKVRRAALLIKAFTDDIPVSVYVMTTGSSGLHLVIPLDGSAVFDDSRKMGRKLTDFLTDHYPHLFTTERLKRNRGEKIYLDIQRNAYAQTAVAPYSLRPISGAPVATPLHWDELLDKSLRAGSWHIKNIRERLDHVADPWKGMKKHAVSVKALSSKIDRKLKYSHNE